MQREEPFSLPADVPTVCAMKPTFGSSTRPSLADRLGAANGRMLTPDLDKLSIAASSFAEKCKVRLSPNLKDGHVGHFRRNGKIKCHSA